MHEVDGLVEISLASAEVATLDLVLEGWGLGETY